MKKLVYLLLLITVSLNAQELSYGLLVGSNFYNSNNNNNNYNFSDNGGSSFNYGGYLEYNFSQNIGIKTEITFVNRQLSYIEPNTGSESIDFDFSYFELAPSFKYDFGQEYRKGFYLLLGPKISLMTKADQDGQDAKDLFETTNFGAQFGIGNRVFKYVDIEAKLDYELAPFFKVDSSKSSIFGAYLSLTIDLEKILNIE